VRGKGEKRGKKKKRGDIDALLYKQRKLRICTIYNYED